MSGASGHDHFDRKDEEFERLRRLVRNLELETRGRHRKRDRKERKGGSASVGGRYGDRSHQSGSNRHRDRSREYADRDSISPEEQRPCNAAMDAMSRALRRAARSPFLEDIEQAPMPNRFMRPLFNSYNGKTDSVEHISHYIQMISLHTHNNVLMCKVFSSSLEPTALR